ncbi:MAG: sigma-54 dependent transcriptional regulator [Myxococcales bacterium]|jgi:DNA-binding NtrC family response regulator
MSQTLQRVLVIDDDAAFRFAMAKALRRSGFEVAEADGGESALPQLLGPEPPHAALLDLRMAGMDGLEVLKRTPNRPTRVIVLTGHGSVESAVEAMKLGAFSFLEKPVDAEVLSPLIAQAVAESQKSRGGRARIDVPPLVGHSAAMEEVRQFVARAGASDETVALYGETGSGKEVVAGHLHLASPRADGPFVALNAACVPRELFESELFGHRKGAFTGATANHPGMFGEAQGGTLFIDEVAELPVETQAKLLRALESGTMRPVGAGRELPVDVRIVAATNRDLWAEVQAGNFREDLYFRLQVLPVALPALRERIEDVPELAEHLLERIGKPGTRISEPARALMLAYDWPGNVRELLNVLRRTVLFMDGPEIDAELMRRMLAASVFGHRGGGAGSAATTQRDEEPVSLAEVERAHIERVLDQLDGNVTRAASALGIDRRTLQRKLKAFGLPSGD